MDHRTPPSPPAPPVALAATRMSKMTQRDIVLMHHAIFGSPTVSTFTEAHRRGWFQLPYMSHEMLLANPPHTEATTKGHLKTISQRLSSTKPKEEPTKPITRAEANDGFCLTRLIPYPEPSTRRHTDLTGPFPVVGVQGARYMMVFFIEGANYIHVEVLNSRNASELVAAHQRANELFKRQGLPCKLEWLGNECPKALIDHFNAEGIAYQFVPPHNHRALRAERAIQTWQNHFVSILATADPDFPLHA